MTQCNLSIDDYCQKIKATADALRDIDHTVVDSQLVPNLLRGFNPRFPRKLTEPETYLLKSPHNTSILGRIFCPHLSSISE